jgi:uncharacterized protein (TIGR00251 family)
MKLPAYLRLQGDGVVIAIKAQPRARTTEVAGVHGNELKVRIAAPPVDSAANEALVEFLAARLGCPRRSVSLLRGGASTHKQVLVVDLPIETLAQRLAEP